MGMGMGMKLWEWEGMGMPWFPTDFVVKIFRITEQHVVSA